MPKVIVCGRGGSGKSTLVSLLAREIAGRGEVLVVDADESNLELNSMLGIPAPERTLMDFLGGKPGVRVKLLARLKGEGDEDATFFDESVTVADLPDDVTSRSGALSMVRIGKTEHSMEGCACPMGAVARSFLNHISASGDEWVLVDTEAGLEHFGRGVLEGADYVLIVVDPSFEAVVLAEKAGRLAEEAGKAHGIVLSKVDEETGPLLREKLAQRGLSPLGSISYSATLARAGLEGEPAADESMHGELGRVVGLLDSSIKG